MDDMFHAETGLDDDDEEDDGDGESMLSHRGLRLDRAGERSRVPRTAYTSRTLS